MALKIRLITKKNESNRATGRDLCVAIVTDSYVKCKSRYGHCSWTPLRVCSIDPAMLSQSSHLAEPESRHLIGSDMQTEMVRQTIRKIEAQLNLAYAACLAELKREPTASEVSQRRKQDIRPKPDNNTPTGPPKTIGHLVDEYDASGTFRTSTSDNHLYAGRVFMQFLTKQGLPKYKFDVRNMTPALLFEWDSYLRTKPKTKGGVETGEIIAPSTQKQYRESFMAMLHFAARKGYIKRDLFWDYSEGKIKPPKILRTAETIRRLLAPELLTRIEKDRADIPLKLRRTRLLFLLQTWTGMGHVDLFHLRVADLIATDLSNRRSIVYNRVKTGEPAILPVFPLVDGLLEQLEYSNKPNNLPVQKDSREVYRKQIIDLFNFYEIPIPSRIGSHTGRHIFGERMLDMGFSMEAISRMMGHSSKDETESAYAQVDHDKIFADLDKIQSQSVNLSLKEQA